MLKFISITLILFPFASPYMGSAEAHARRFSCPELHSLHKGTKAFRDTLEACKWDYANPDPKAIVR